VGLFQQDIKKVIAYSTMSQLGMMVIAIGLSSYNLALFHLVNHAFYLTKFLNLIVIKFIIGYLFFALNKFYSTNKLSCDNYTANLKKTPKTP
jgi:NADH:ubiquinone oxidoreductase subunit 4 (subunit M)